MYLTLLTLIAFCCHLTSAFYLPGVAPKDYKKGNLVELDVNVLTSSNNLLSYDFYYERFHHVKPEQVDNKRENLGSILFGDRLHNSDFELNMLVNDTCATLGTVTIPAKDAKFINDRIKEGYQQNWFVDGLPAAEEMYDTTNEQTFYQIGFSLGQYDLSKPNQGPWLNNHYDILIKYHSDEQKELHRVVGVLVWPSSVAETKTENCAVDPRSPPTLKLDETKENKVTYTYTVRWEPSNVSWGTRWDNYLYVFDPNIHWFSIVNSIVIVLMLTGVIAMILIRALHKDIARYNTYGDEDAQEDFGWKLVHADVFRPPKNRMLLSVLVGNGVQLFCMSGVTLLFAMLGFLSPSSRGLLVTVALMFYICFASVAGYVSARLYKMNQGEFWKRNIFTTATLVPGVVFAIFLFLNFFLIGANSSAAVPFGTMFTLILLWFLVSVPMCAVGAYYGFKKDAIKNPVRTNQIPRQIPPGPWYLRPIPMMLLAGIPPFTAVYIELHFIMNSLWFGRVYYVFGFLAIVFGILGVTCSEIAILGVYFTLNAEDYYWSWRAFFAAGGSGFYVFLASVIYYVRSLTLDNLPSAILYFGWSLVMSVLFTVLTGSIGYWAGLYFVRKIFGAIKVD
ncbi:hypothetical protein HDU85_001442 [Gaertneriomyces sp. JEL0708]|nr:hypothetical protein HDU85_001442 [Gaertneriomyces sp. JEL0708]